MENNLYPVIYNQKENKISPNTSGIIVLVIFLLLIFYYLTSNTDTNEINSSVTNSADLPSDSVSTNTNTSVGTTTGTSTSTSTSVGTTTGTSTSTSVSVGGNTSAPIVPNVVLPYEYLGCYNYPGYLDITNLERTGNLKDDYKLRTDAVEKCYIESKSRNIPFFGVMDGGRCMGLNESQYKLKGSSNQCIAGGKGAKWANAVYKINN